MSNLLPGLPAVGSLSMRIFALFKSPVVLDYWSLERLGRRSWLLYWRAGFTFFSTTSVISLQVRHECL